MKKILSSLAISTALLLVIGLGVSCQSNPKTVEPVAIKPVKESIRKTEKVSSISQFAKSSQKIHTVRWGNTLRKIAKRYYGNERSWQIIYRVNQDQIGDPDLIIVGQRLTIPPR